MECCNVFSLHLCTAAAQSTATCQALQSLASNSVAQFRCSVTEACIGIECDATLIQGAGDYHTEVTFLPCEQPLPSITLTFSEPNGDVALITTLNHSANLPLTSAAFTSTVMLTVDQVTDGIGFQVSIIICYTLDAVDFGGSCSD